MMNDNEEIRIVLPKGMKVDDVYKAIAVANVYKETILEKTEDDDGEPKEIPNPQSAEEFAKEIISSKLTELIATSIVVSDTMDQRKEVMAKEVEFNRSVDKRKEEVENMGAINIF